VEKAVRQWNGKPAEPPSLAKDVLTTRKSEEEDKNKTNARRTRARRRPETGKSQFQGADDLCARRPAGSVTQEDWRDVTKDQLVGQLIANATAHVPKQMRDKAGEIKSGLTPFFPDRQKVLNALHGATKTQGTDFKNYWDGEDPLVDTIDTKFNRGMSDKATKDADKAAALAALEGDAKAAAIQELRAAFNLWDDEQKAYDALLALSPEALADMSPEQKAELEQMCDDLGGVNKEKFRALLDDKVAKYNALTIRDDIKAKRRAEGEEGWTGVGDALDTYSTTAGQSALSGNKDAFGIDPTKEGQTQAKARAADMWTDTVLEFGARSTLALRRG
jgi:hypothetical protein